MSDVQIEAIVKAALAQSEHRVEACVVFLDDFTGAALADLVLEAHRWSICAAGDYALPRALGAALRYPELEVVVCLHVDEGNQRQVQRCCALAEEMAVTNVSLYGCGPAAEAIDGLQPCQCSARARVYIDPWVACPLHTQQFAFTAVDSEEPSMLLKRIREWSGADSLIEIWDAHQYADVALTLMVAAQYAAQGRQVWIVLEPADLLNAEVIAIARAIGQAQLPLKCLTISELSSLRGIPWSQWARLRGWWIHQPLDAEEGLAWMQSSLDHMWPALICLPQQWMAGFEPLRFAAARQSTECMQQNQIFCMPQMLAVGQEAQAALAAMGIDISIQIITSLAPLSQINYADISYLCIIDNALEAPLSDILLPQLSGRSTLQFDMCGPEQCQGHSPAAADVAACIRAALGK